MWLWKLLQYDGHLQIIGWSFRRMGEVVTMIIGDGNARLLATASPLIIHSALALFVKRTRIPTPARSIGFCVKWARISRSTNSATTQQAVVAVITSFVKKLPCPCLVHDFWSTLTPFFSGCNTGPLESFSGLRTTKSTSADFFGGKTPVGAWIDLLEQYCWRTSSTSAFFMCLCDYCVLDFLYHRESVN